MTENLKLWNAIKRPPAEALKPILAGRLKGKSDISPQWRYRALTEQLGPCGTGWKYEIKRVWSEPGSDNQIFAFAEILLYVKNNDQWSDGIPGIGGSMLVAKEKSGPYSSDEGYKMAVTDALSVAMKMIGMAADIYEGLWDGSKYTKNDPEPEISDEVKKEINKITTKEDLTKYYMDHKGDYKNPKPFHALITDRLDQINKATKKDRGEE